MPAYTGKPARGPRFPGGGREGPEPAEPHEPGDGGGGERLAVASDHGGFLLKRELVSGLSEAGYAVVDLGTDSDEACDYPDFALAAAQGLLNGEFDRAIVIDGTGVGMALAVNRHPGIRAVNCSDVFTARYARAHHDCNVLALGGRVIGVGLAWEVVKVWLTTPFQGGKRHVRRLAKIDGG